MTDSLNRLNRLLWAEPAPCTINEACLNACEGDAFLATILIRRGYTNPDKIRAFLSSDLYLPAPPEQLPDLVVGSSLLQTAIANGKHILIWGDFDVDGQTSTALLVDGLQRLGGEVTYYIPERVAESHGIKLASLQQQIEAQKPDLIITCDTGISEYEALDYAHSIGLPVIVTDHHELGDHLPAVAAVITPRRLPDGHALASLPGVGVAYKLMQHVYTTLHQERDLPRLLDLVALGIVGDVAMQTDDTRYLLQVGLERLRRAERVGLKALMEVANLTPAGLTGERIAYQIGPRLNAAGRLANAALAVELLITHQASQARVLAQQLEGLNNERRVQTRQIETAAEAMITANPSLLDAQALVLYQPDWNPGIIGIVAAHLSERYARPVVLLAGHDIARGSARAPRSFDVNRSITAQADLLRTFGGHPGAAGLSLEVRHIDRFRERFSRTLAEGGMAETQRLNLDTFVTFDQLTLDLAKRIQRLAPFGEGNRPVILATARVRLAHASLVGRDRLHRRMTVEDEQGRQQIVLWWHSADDTLPDGLFDIAYNIGVNDRQELQLTFVDFRQCEDSVIDVPAPAIHIHDWRRELAPVEKLQVLLAESQAYVIWAEAESRQQYPDWKRRAELMPARTLILYTAPPDPQTLREALDLVKPETIHIFGTPPPIPSLQAFLMLLTQSAQNVIDHLDGETVLEILCGATASSPQMARAGLEFLVANGQLGSTIWIGKGGKLGKTKVRLTATSSSENSIAPALPRDIARKRLEAAYREMEAYRRYFRAAPLDRLL
ncbi:MAG: single-stranded-DNA-specific exonuclease RecJ [Chloroflexota bacterium]